MSTRDTLNFLKNMPSNLKEVTINGAYTLPEIIGNPFDLMAVPSSGTLLNWDTGGGGGGGVNSVSNVDGTLSISPQQGNVVASINPNLSLSSLTITDQYILPSTIGTAGQVLAVPNSGNTLVWSSDAGGTVDSVIAGSPNMIISPTTGNVVVNLSNSVDIETLTINNSYVLPSTIGNVGDTLVVQSGTNVLEFAPNEGSGVTGITNSDGQITLSSSTGVVNVGLADNIQVQSLYINNGSADYFLPNVQGNVGDTIVIQSGSNQLIWAPNEGSGVTSLTAGMDGNINLDANTGDIIINLSNAISVNGLTLNSYPIQDPSTASANQVLAINPTNNGIIWIDDVSGGVNSISNTDSNITFSAPTGAVTCALSSTVNIQNLEVNSSTFQNPNSGGQYQALTLDANNDMIWSTLVNTIANSDGNIVVDNPTGAVSLDLAPSISVTGITINGSTFESPQNGNVADVLALDANKNMVWVPDTAGTGVTDINNSDGNISVSNPTGTVTLDLATSIAVENITIGLAPDAYAMPSTIGTDGQVLGVIGTTVSWVDAGSVTGVDSIACTDGNIVFSAPTGNVTCALASTLAVENITIDSSTFQNPNSGSVGQVLVLDSNNNMVWGSDALGGVASIACTDGNIVFSASTGNVTCALNSTVDVQDLSINGKTLQNPIDGSAGQLLGLDSNNNMVWLNDTPGNLTVEGTANEITAITAGDVVTLSLPNNTRFPTNITTCAVGNGAIAIGNNALGTDPQDALSGNIGIGQNTGIDLSTGSGERNILIGSNSGNAISSTDDNIFIGVNCATTAVGGGNIAIGTDTGANLDSAFTNVLIGYGVDIPVVGNNGQVNINNLIKMNNNGSINIGKNNHENLSSTGNGSLIVSIGDSTLTNITEASENNMVAIGCNTGNKLTTGNYNTLLGNQNLAFDNNITANNNVVIGNFVGENISNGSYNIVMGNLSCNGDNSVNSTCTNNIVIGNNSANTNFNTTSNNNVIIGNGVDLPFDSTNNYLCIKTNEVVLSGTSDQLQVPNFKNIWNTDATEIGQVLTATDTNGGLEWSYPLITGLDNSDNNIVISAESNPSNKLVNLSSDVFIQNSLRVENSIYYGGNLQNPLDGAPTNVLTIDTYGDMVWTQGISSAFLQPNLVSSVETGSIFLLTYSVVGPNPPGFYFDLCGQMKMLTIVLGYMIPNGNTPNLFSFTQQTPIPTQFLPFTYGGAQVTTVIGTFPITVYQINPGVNDEIVDTCQMQVRISNNNQITIDFLNYVPPFSGYSLYIQERYYGFGISTNDVPPINAAPAIVSVVYR